MACVAVTLAGTFGITLSSTDCTRGPARDKPSREARDRLVIALSILLLFLASGWADGPVAELSHRRSLADAQAVVGREEVKP